MLESSGSTLSNESRLVDGFGRRITYVRLSVTDRCDLRCRYCMAEDMTFLPRHELLSIEELARLGTAFTELGVHKIRVTGGEPLIRQGVVKLMAALGRLRGMKELCLTTNATHLRRYAQALSAAGVQRVNISLESLLAERLRRLTRHGDLPQVLDGIRAAQEAGFERIQLDCVALKNFNDDEAPELVRSALDEGLDISYVDEMPLGKNTDHGLAAEFVSSQQLSESM